MGNAYLRAKIFGMALKELAVGTDTISVRLDNAWTNHLYKINWETDVNAIPKDYKDDFQELKVLVHDTPLLKFQQKQNELKKTYSENNIPLSDNRLDELTNFRDFIKGMHWRKAQQAAKLIAHIYFGLSEN